MQMANKELQIINLKNYELEKYVLASLMLGEENYIDRLRESDFYSSTHQEIFRAILEVVAEGKKPDIATLSSKIKDIGYLIDVLNLVPSGSNIVQWINELKEFSNKRRLQKTLIRTLNQLTESETIENILADLDSEIRQIETNSTTVVSISEVVDRLNNRETFDKLFNSEYSTGLIDLDKIWHIHRGDLVIIAGRPSMGKSAFMLALAKNFAKKGIGTHIFSIEMSLEQLGVRLASSESDVGVGVEPDFEETSKGFVRVKNLPLYLSEKAVLGVSDVKETVRKMSKQGVEIFFIDYLGLMEPPQAETRNLELAEITRKMKIIAKEYNVVIVLLSQLSRAVEQRGDKRPMLSDLRDSGAIEQDADTVIFLYRPEYYGIATVEKEGELIETTFLCELLIPKQRQYKTGETWVFYDRSRNFFSDWYNRGDKSLPF
ncbi:MAG: replicative DNA helicase [Candidatus Methanofastidiosum methylothiophilum]|uniref:DNA 5'-3' helicase n=1 Tax=Candidatus Methanofastidiosum methylothiophilum TaxID=1705564 RepID=A0A150ISK4_9EURY|nr:MAG: replicative DNA helicase [Candidatus Methanofastidiosum methylthiophilus]KYC53549.1 MAG: replicative DNA helicase [Candidatus Methanofastidiosum methylthiophilus]